MCEDLGWNPSKARSTPDWRSGCVAIPELNNVGNSARPAGPQYLGIRSSNCETSSFASPTAVDAPFRLSRATSWSTTPVAVKNSPAVHQPTSAWSEAPEGSSSAEARAVIPAVRIPHPADSQFTEGLHLSSCRLIRARSRRVTIVPGSRGPACTATVPIGISKLAGRVTGTTGSASLAKIERSSGGVHDPEDHGAKYMDVAAVLAHEQDHREHDGRPIWDELRVLENLLTERPEDLPAPRARAHDQRHSRFDERGQLTHLVRRYRYHGGAD